MWHSSILLRSFCMEQGVFVTFGFPLMLCLSLPLQSLLVFILSSAHIRSPLGYMMVILLVSFTWLKCGLAFFNLFLSEKVIYEISLAMRYGLQVDAQTVIMMVKSENTNNAWGALSTLARETTTTVVAVSHRIVPLVQLSLHKAAPTPSAYSLAKLICFVNFDMSEGLGSKLTEVNWLVNGSAMLL